MKVNVTFDCTPDEARRFLGLPDVTAFQDEMMDIMRDKILENMKIMEPDQAMKIWASFMNQGMNQGMNMGLNQGVNMGMDFFKNMMTGGAMNMASSAKSAKQKSDSKSDAKETGRKK